MERLSGKYFFVADVHLGCKDDVDGRRERAFCEFLDALPSDISGLYLLGDIFDFWVEYKAVVPRGFVRVLGRLAALADAGCDVVFFKGNHDYWVTDYFNKELGVRIIDDPYAIIELDGQRLCIGHGDVLGCTDFKARLIFSLFRNRFLISLLKAFPTSWIFSFAKNWSSHSRKSGQNYVFEVEKSDIRRFAESMGTDGEIDRFIFGHFHRRVEMKLDCGATLDILGDWTDGPSYLYL